MRGDRDLTAEESSTPRRRRRAKKPGAPPGTLHADPDAPEDAGDQPQSAVCEPPAVELQAFFPPEEEKSPAPPPEGP